MKNKKLKLRSPLMFQMSSADMESPTGDSITIQNDAYSIPELMRRSSGHLRDNVTRDGYYSDDDDHDQIDLNQIQTADLIEREQALKTQLEIDVEKAKQSKGKKPKAPSPVKTNSEKDEKANEQSDSGDTSPLKEKNKTGEKPEPDGGF